MKSFLIVLLTAITIICYAQDTLYCDAYPNGLLIKDLPIESLNKNKITIDKGEFKIITPTQEIIKINSQTGLKFTNREYKKTDQLIIPTDKITGKFLYTDVIEAKGLSQKQIYEALKIMPSSDVYFAQLNNDETTFSQLGYRVYTNVRHAGDLYTLYCTLIIRIKEGKLKYEISDFRMYFSEQKTFSALGNNNYTTGATHVVNSPAETWYLPNERDSKNKILATVIKISDTSISAIKTAISKSDW